MNNFIHRETVEVQYKQTAIQQQTAINEKSIIHIINNNR